MFRKHFSYSLFSFLGTLCLLSLLGITTILTSLGFSVLTPPSVYGISQGDAIVNRGLWYMNQNNYYPHNPDNSNRLGQYNAQMGYGFDCSGFVYKVFMDAGYGDLIHKSTYMKAGHK